MKKIRPRKWRKRNPYLKFQQGKKENLEMPLITRRLKLHAWKDAPKNHKLVSSSERRKSTGVRKGLLRTTRFLVSFLRTIR